MTHRNLTSRRGVLLSIGTASLAGGAGCLDNGFSVDGDPEYESGEVPDLDADNRTAEEMATAEALAEQQVSQSVTPIDALELADHEFVLESGYLGPTVQGTVENTGGDRIEIVEVRVRIYNAAGERLGRYLASTGDLDGGTSWGFQVVVLESPTDISDYDITVLGTPT